MAVIPELHLELVYMYRAATTSPSTVSNTTRSRSPPHCCLSASDIPSMTLPDCGINTVQTRMIPMVTEMIVTTVPLTSMFEIILIGIFNTDNIPICILILFIIVVHFCERTGEKMRKYVAIIEGRGIKKYNLSKVTLPMTTIRSHLYRTDEKLFHL